jgi:hypothetical protein
MTFWVWKGHLFEEVFNANRRSFNETANLCKLSTIFLPLFKHLRFLNIWHFGFGFGQDFAIFVFCSLYHFEFERGICLRRFSTLTGGLSTKLLICSNCQPFSCRSLSSCDSEIFGISVSVLVRILPCSLNKMKLYCTNINVIVMIKLKIGWC